MPSEQPIPRLRTPPFEIESLPKLDLTGLSNAPAQPGVYLAIDDAGRVWYVGIADSLRQRLTAHDRLNDFQSHGVSHIAWLNESRPENRREIEKQLIEFCHPPLNNQNNFNNLPTFDYGLSQEEEVERFFKLRIQQKLIERIRQTNPSLDG
jgi:excinuclease UvrABC nuclease subunit